MSTITMQLTMKLKVKKKRTLRLHKTFSWEYMIQIKLKDWFFSLSCVGWAWITIFSCFATSANNRLIGKRISLTHFRNVMFSSQQLKYAQPWQPLTLKTDILFPVQLSGRSAQMLLLQWRYVSQCKPEIFLAVTWAETLSFSLTHTCR